MNIRVVRLISTKNMIINLVFIMLFLKLLEVKGGSVANRYSVEESSENDELGNLLDRQTPNDMVYDLAGNAILITIDDLTDKYLTFKVEKDPSGLPYVKDPETGLHYLVVSSRTSREIGLYRLTVDSYGRPEVVDWETETINRVRLSDRGQVWLEPIKKLPVHQLSSFNDS